MRWGHVNGSAMGCCLLCAAGALALQAGSAQAQNVPVPQPPPRPGGCRGADCVDVTIPRDEIVASAVAATAVAGHPTTPYVDIVDISQLGANEELSEIDTGVTSGADPSEWDPITIDDQAPNDSCRNETAATQSGNSTAPATCESTTKPKKPTA